MRQRRSQDCVRAWHEADRKQGRTEGVEQERALLLRLTGRKFGADTAGRFAALLAGIEDPERLADGRRLAIEGTEGRPRQRPPPPP